MKETLLAKIRGNEVRMRPRAFFVAKLCAIAFVAGLIIVVSVGIFNFISFSLRINHHDALLGFGSRGIFLFMRFFPWWLAALDVALVLVLEWLLRQFRFASRIPMLYLLVLMLGITVTTGVAIDRATPLNDHFLGQADRDELPPPIGQYFEGARVPPPGDGSTCKCMIVSIDGNTVTAQEVDAATTTILTITIPSDAPELSSLTIGDIVFIAGDRHNHTISAFGVHKTPNTALQPRPQQ